MKNLFVPLTLGLLCTSFATIPAEKTANRDSYIAAVTSTLSTDSSDIKNDLSSQLYHNCDLASVGLSRQAFDYAWKGYNYLLERNKITRSAYLTICDFSQSSKRKRLYIIDIASQKLVINTWVAHGKNSGEEYANQFSNRPESLQSSLGFYVTANTYIGEHGLSLRINGVDPGFNDKALERSIVIHGAGYVNGERAKSGMYMGRSWGCPAVPQQEVTNIITTIKNGTCLFIYHPSKSYLNRSKILNG